MLRKIAIITTTRCDLRCAHCLRGYPDEHQDFPLDLLERLLKEARPYGAKHVALTGGEPGLHPEFAQLVQMAAEAGFAWSFVSNGQRTDLYEPLMTKYRRSLTHVVLSIDGADAATHDKIRCKEGSFDRVIRAAQHYTEKKFPLQIVVTLNQTNKAQVSELVDLAKQLKAYRISFSGTIPTPANQDLVLSDAESLNLYRSIQTLKQNAGIEIRTFSGLHTSGGVHFCGILDMRELTFNPNGELLFCCDVPDPGGMLGSLAKQPLSVLMNEWLTCAAQLQICRTERIAAGQMGEGFDTCAFCSEYFNH